MSKAYTPIYIIGDPKFSNPNKGIAPHPLEGIGHIRNLDILSNPGSVRLNYQTVKQSFTTVTGKILYMRTNPSTGVVYAIDENGVVYTATNAGGTWAVIAGNSGGSGGLEIWKDYLVVIGTNNLDAYGPLSGSPGWHNNFTGSNLVLTETGPWPIFRSLDDSLYIGNGRYIARLQETTTFDPITAATFTWTQKAITLAKGYVITVMRDLGVNLMVGTIFANSITIADIFPYLRSTLTLGLPIRIVEQGIQAMYNLGNRLYVLAGTTGKLFITDTVSATQIAQIPNYIMNLDSGMGLNMNPDSIMYLKGKIYFGVGNSSIGNAGVWSYNPTAKVLQMENIISTGNDGTSASVNVTSLLPLSVDSYLLAWKDTTSGTVYGVDLLDHSNRITSYGGYIDGPLLKVGEALANTTAPQLEINLTKPLVSGQGVRIQYRKDLTSSFTTLVTADFATYGAYQSYNFPAGVMTNLVYLQVRALLTTGSGNGSPELQSVLLVNPT